MTTPHDASPRRLPAPDNHNVVYGWVSRTQEVMAFRMAGRLIVCSAICPHMGARLTLDRARGRIECPWHGLWFSLPDGGGDHERYRQLRLFAATAHDGHVDVE